MEIYKILNNNVIVSKNEHDKEIIAMGKGIAFKKKVGMTPGIYRKHRKNMQ